MTALKEQARFKPEFIEIEEVSSDIAAADEEAATRDDSDVKPGDGNSEAGEVEKPSSSAPKVDGGAKLIEEVMASAKSVRKVESAAIRCYNHLPVDQLSSMLKKAPSPVCSSSSVVR